MFHSSPKTDAACRPWSAAGDVRDYEHARGRGGNLAGRSLSAAWTAERFLPELCCLKYFDPLGEVLAREIPAFTELLAHKYDVRGALAADAVDAAAADRRRGHGGHRRRQDVLGPAGRLGWRACR